MYALGREVLHVVERAAALVVELHHRADVFLRHDDRRLDVRLLDFLELAREVGRVVHLDPLRVVSLLHAVRDGRRGDEQVEVELALEPLAHDLHVQQAEEAAAEAEAERLRRLGLVEERAVVQLQPLERVAQLRVLRRSPSGRDRRTPSASRPCSRAAAPAARTRNGRDRVADAQARDVLEARDDVADLARGRATRRASSSARRSRAPRRRSACPSPSSAAPRGARTSRR